MTSVRKSYISIYVKIIATEKESKRKLLYLTLGNRFTENNKVYDFWVRISIIHS